MPKEYYSVMLASTRPDKHQARGFWRFVGVLPISPFRHSPWGKWASSHCSIVFLYYFLHLCCGCCCSLCVSLNPILTFFFSVKGSSSGQKIPILYITLALMITTKRVCDFLWFLDCKVWHWVLVVFGFWPQGWKRQVVELKRQRTGHPLQPALDMQMSVITLGSLLTVLLQHFIQLF